MAKVHRLPAQGNTSLPIPKTVYEPKTFYSLFENVNGKWIRISDNSYSDAKTACEVFTSRLIDKPLSRRIRPCEIDLSRAQGLSRFRAVSYNELRDSPLREKESR